MAFFFVGTSEIGRVERCGPTWVGTSFLIFNMLPLVPLSSTLHRGDGSQRTIPMHWGSVVAAYARVYPLAAAVIVLFLHRNAMGAGIAGALALVGLAAFGLGRLSADEQAKRWVTAEVVGDPVGLEHVKSDLAPIRSQLESTWAARSVELAARGYRAQPSLDDAAMLDDREALRTAFVLTRIDEALGSPHAARERAIWKRMTELGT